jgi:hypothetical protein
LGLSRYRNRETWSSPFVFYLNGTDQSSLESENAKRSSKPLHRYSLVTMSEYDEVFPETSVAWPQTA